MSCDGCRVLRKGCKDDCILRESLQWIQNPQSQGYATLFVARFFGRAGLFSFISAVPSHQRPGLFKSLLFEAAGRTVNPVSGYTGLVWTGNWQMCQSAVDTVLQGGMLSPAFDLPGVGSAEIDFFNPPGTTLTSTLEIKPNALTTTHRRSETRVFDDIVENTKNSKRIKVKEATLFDGDESETTTMFECRSSNYNNSNLHSKNKAEMKLLKLFV